MSLEMSLLIVLYRIAGTIVFFLTLYQLAKALWVADRIRDRMIYLGFLALNILLSSVWVFFKPIPGVLCILVSNRIPHIADTITRVWNK